jgi:hypothetical protein
VAYASKNWFGYLDWRDQKYQWTTILSMPRPTVDAPTAPTATTITLDCGAGVTVTWVIEQDTSTSPLIWMPDYIDLQLDGQAATAAIEHWRTSGKTNLWQKFSGVTL